MPGVLGRSCFCAPGLTEINARHQKSRGGGLKASAYRAPALKCWRNRHLYSRMRLRDLPHIANRLRRIVSAQTSRGDFNMRKFILIAGFALVSVAAQAGDRSLSLGGGDTTKVSAPAKATEGPRTAEVPQAAEAPKYVERPAVVERKAETSRSETVKTGTTRTETTS